MRPLTAMRASAWNALWSGGWFFRCSAVMVVFMLVLDLTSTVLSMSGVDVVKSAELLRRQAVYGGSVDVKAVVRQLDPMWYISAAFGLFIVFLVSSFERFAVTSVSLRAADAKSEKWFVSSFNGLNRPFEVLWLLLRRNIQVMLWMALLVVPGIIALYRYRMAWFLKVENPDLGAGECLRESCRLMKGRKWHMFIYDCTYLIYLPAVLVVYIVDSMLLGPFCFLLWSAYFFIGNAVYYRELKSSGS